jgi:hypothetical protein
VFPAGRHEAAAVVTFLSPGLRLLQEGQLAGRRVRVPVQLLRAPEEPEDAALAAFYRELMSLLREGWFRRGSWDWLEVTPAEAGEPVGSDLLAWGWEEGAGGRRAVVLVNYGPEPVRVAVSLARGEAGSAGLRWRGLLGKGVVQAGEVAARAEDGKLRVDLGPWDFQVFEVTGTK